MAVDELVKEIAELRKDEEIDHAPQGDDNPLAEPADAPEPTETDRKPADDDDSGEVEDKAGKGEPEAKSRFSEESLGRADALEIPRDEIADMPDQKSLDFAIRQAERAYRKNGKLPPWEKPPKQDEPPKVEDKKPEAITKSELEEYVSKLKPEDVGQDLIDDLQGRMAHVTKLSAKEREALKAEIESVKASHDEVVSELQSHRAREMRREERAVQRAVNDYLENNPVFKEHFDGMTIKALKANPNDPKLAPFLRLIQQYNIVAKSIAENDDFDLEDVPDAVGRAFSGAFRELYEKQVQKTKLKEKQERAARAAPVADGRKPSNVPTGDEEDDEEKREARVAEVLQKIHGRRR